MSSMRVCLDILGGWEPELFGAWSSANAQATRTEIRSNRAGKRRNIMEHPRSRSARIIARYGAACWTESAGSGGEAEAVAGDLEGQDAAAVVADRGRHAAGSPLLDQEDDASAAAGSTDLGGAAAVFSGDRDQLIDQGRSDAGGIGSPQFPFFAEQAGHLVPVRVQERVIHGAGDFRDALKVAKHALLTIDVRFEDFPVVNAR